MIAERNRYLKDEVEKLQKIWPDNRSMTIVCHGHSIPCGYMAQNVTQPFDAYPHILHQELANRFPHSVINVIVSAVGGENCVSGARRFQRDVLDHHPDIITIDYGRNDMFLTADEVRASWSQMIREAKTAGAKVLLISPAADSGSIYYEPSRRKLTDQELTEVISELAVEYEVGFADAHSAFEQLFAMGHTRWEYAASVNHPNRRGHEVIVKTLMEWFPYV